MPTAAATAAATAIAAKMAAAAECPHNPAQVILDKLRRRIREGAPEQLLLLTCDELGSALLDQRAAQNKERLEMIMALMS